MKRFAYLVLSLGIVAATFAQAAPDSSPEPTAPLPDSGCSLPPGVRVGVACKAYANGVVTILTIEGKICDYRVATGWENACADRCPGLMDVIYKSSDQSVACVPYHGPGPMK